MKKTVVLLLAALGWSAVSQAETRFWSGSASSQGGAGNWDVTNPHWSISPGGPFDLIWNNTNVDDAVFDATGGSVTNTTAITVGKITAGVSGYSLNGTGKVTFSGTNAGVDYNLTTGSFAINSPLGTDANSVFHKTGNGRLTLNNSGNTISKYVVQAGIMTAAAANRYGTAPATVVPDFITLDGGALGFDTTLNWDLGATRGITLGAQGGRIALSSASITNTISGPITGVGSLSFPSSVPSGTYGTAGRFILSNPANDYTGGTTVSIGTLLLGASGVLPNTTTVTLNGGNLDLNGFDEVVGNVIVSSSSSAISGSTNTLTATNFDVRASGTIAAILAGNAKLTKTTTGTVTLTGPNSFNGGVAHNAGTLRVNNNTALGAANTSVTLADGVTLSTSSTTARTLTYNYTINGDISLGQASGGTGALTLAGSVNLAGAPRTVTIVNASDAISAVISNGGLIKAGTGNLDLTGANTFSGGLQLTQGTLRVNNNTALGAANSAVTLAQDVTLATTTTSARTLTHAFTLNGDITLGQVSGGTAALTLGGTMDLATGNRTIIVSNSTDTISAVISNGAITKQGAGTLVLTGANTYSDGTTVNEGVLQGSTSGLQGSIANNASVAFNQTTTGTFNGVINGNGTVSKSGSGAVTFANDQNYTGATTVSAGSLFVNGGLISPSVVVSAGGTLGGTGNIAGNVSVAGVINPGAGVGALTIGNGLDLSSGGTNVWQLGNFKDDSDGLAGTDFDQTILSGGDLFLGTDAKLSIQFTGNAAAPSYTNAFWLVNHTWKIISISGSANNATNSNFGAILNGTFAAGTFSTEVLLDGSISLKYTAIAPVAPSITTQPISQTVNSGATVTFTVQATGSQPLSYQWRLGGQDIPGATGSSCSITNVQSANAGTYSVMVTNIAGFDLSSDAVLTVNSAQPTIAPPVISGGNIFLNWGTTPGSTYEVQFKPNLNAPSWISLTNFVASGSSASFTNAVAGNEGYFRIVVP